jgi:hypothetical protein
MAKLRALLVGVTYYEYKLKEWNADGTAKEHKSKNMFSAGHDVEAVRNLIGSLTAPKGTTFDSAEVLCLRTGENTTRDMILDYGLPWLFRPPATKSVTDPITGKIGLIPDPLEPWPQLLLYFSGHGMRIPAPGSTPTAPYWDEVLCPSDTNWKDVFISDEDILRRGYDALNHGAWLEVVLEACSSGGVFKPSAKDIGDPNRTLRFGCLFNQKSGGAFPMGSGAVWSAARPDQNSHSGRYPFCDFNETTNPVRGLFTKYFCEGVSQKIASTRDSLCLAVDGSLKKYADDFNVASCCKRLKNMESQNPGLACSSVARTQAPFAGTGIKNDPSYQTRLLQVLAGTEIEPYSITHADGVTEVILRFKAVSRAFPKVGVCL